MIPLIKCCNGREVRARAIHDGSDGKWPARQMARGEEARFRCSLTLLSGPPLSGRPSHNWLCNNPLVHAGLLVGDRGTSWAPAGDHFEARCLGEGLALCCPFAGFIEFQTNISSCRKVRLVFVARAAEHGASQRPVFRQEKKRRPTADRHAEPVEPRSSRGSEALFRLQPGIRHQSRQRGLAALQSSGAGAVLSSAQVFAWSNWRLPSCPELPGAVETFFSSEYRV